MLIFYSFSLGIIMIFWFIWTFVLVQKKKKKKWTLDDSQSLLVKIEDIILVEISNKAKKQAKLDG